MNFAYSVSNQILSLVRCVFTMVHHLYCYPAWVMYALLLSPLRWLRPALFWQLIDFLADWLYTMGSWYSWSAGYGIVEAGDDISPCLNQRTLILPNHQTPCDVIVMCNILIANNCTFNHCIWVMNEEFKYTPFGAVSMIKKDFYIPIGREKRDQGLISFKNFLEDCVLPMKHKTILLFPEGGFLHKRRAKSQQFALQHNLPVLQNVCLPRLGAVRTIVEVCTTGGSREATYDTRASDDNLQWILDVTIAYPKGIPMTLGNVCTASRGPFNTLVVYRLFPASQISSPADVADWIYKRWQEKENFLTNYYKTGTIDLEGYCHNPKTPRLLVQNRMQHFLIHLFFICSTYVFYKMFCLVMVPSFLQIFTVLVMYVTFVALKVTKRI